MVEQRTATGVLVLRVWSEPDDDRVRARITRTVDVSLASEESLVAQGPEQVVDAVRAFLTDFVARPRSGAPR